MKRILLSLLSLAIVLAAAGPLRAAPGNPPTALLLCEGKDDPANLARGPLRQLAELLGHFSLSTTMLCLDDYRAGTMKKYDFVFFIGFTLRCSPPEVFLRDANERSAPLIWIYTGMEAFNRLYPTPARFGFETVRVDSSTPFASVDYRGMTFTKGDKNTTITRVTDPKRCEVLATTTAKRTTVPFLLRSGNFWFFTDSPLSYTSENDRYLLFAELLHTILGQEHETIHRALIRIEDVHPLEDPSRLRAVADLLSDEGVPFLVALIPFYVDPAQNIRVSLSEKPDFVDAIRYMVRKGGTIVMHGSTHQYRGVTASDYEFWDESRNKPIKQESPEYVRQKLVTGVEECLRNGIYPIIWETPHYTASQLDYDAIAKVFSTAMEQRLSIDNFDYSQFFPYTIQRDLHGEEIYPEDLGFVPFDPDAPDTARNQVTRILDYARTMLAVRDGYASCFYHSFVPLENLERLVRGIKELGYTFFDPKQESHSVVLDDKAILTGSGSVTLTLRDQFLREYYINPDGSIAQTVVLPNRITGKITRTVSLDGGRMYVATPTELREREVTFWDKLKKTLLGVKEYFFPPKKIRTEARVAVVYDSTLIGGAMKDQRSFIHAFRCVSIPVDTLHANSLPPLNGYNLIVVPYAAVEALSDAAISAIVEWVRGGGNCVIDGKTELSKEFGIRYTGSTLRVAHIRDRRYPEEFISWDIPEPIEMIEIDEADEIFAVEDETQSPLVVGRKFGEGKLLYFGSRFDPASDGGWSRYPYFVEYVRKLFTLSPILRRDALEMFYDPGVGHKSSIETVVKQWADNGVRAIHAANWATNPKWTYDYERLVRLCHANGILVYAWIEPPYVTRQFWDEHPAWREKNAAGADARPSWRYPMAMTDPACLEAMIRYYRAFLEKHDFDGVNIGEVSFESGVGGVQEPEKYTPMHPSARAEFRAKAGFDPALLLDPASARYWKHSPSSLAEFEEYRIDKLDDALRALLTMATEIRGKRPGFDIIVTQLDNLGTPALRKTQGIDMMRLAALRVRFPFSINVEDPMARWSEDPRRYAAIAESYRKILGDDFLLDLNILSFRQREIPTPFPTLVQTGTEAFSLVSVASQAARRVIMYSESSINPQDVPLLAFASAGAARIERIAGGYAVTSPTSVVLHLGSDRQYVMVDGEIRTSVSDGRILIAAGRHVVRTDVPSGTVFSTDQLRVTIISCTGNLLYQKEEERSVDFGYVSGPRCLVSLNKPPVALFVDGRELPVEVWKGNERFTLSLPAGRHDVRIITRSTVSYGIDLTSLWSSWLIVLFGFVSVGTLGVFYVIVRIRRGAGRDEAEGAQKPERG